MGSFVAQMSRPFQCQGKSREVRVEGWEQDRNLPFKSGRSRGAGLVAYLRVQELEATSGLSENTGLSSLRRQSLRENRP